MIAKKAKKSGGFGGRIDYILEEVESKEQRGKYLNCSSDLADCIPIDDLKGTDGDKISMLMKEQASKNKRVSKACYHQIFSFPQGERPSDEVLSDISKEFAEEFGFTQWLSVKHEDTKKLHIHFVGNIVDNNGKVSVNDSNDYYRLNDFVKYINEKHDLQRVGTIKEKGESLENKQIQRLQKIIDKALLTEGVNDIKTLQNQLLKSGVKSFTQRGITFIDKHSGVQFKGSKLGKGYSLNALEKKIRDKDVKQEIKSNPYEALKTIIEIEAKQSKNLEEFRSRIAKHQIDSSRVDNVMTFDFQGEKLSETQLGEDYALKNIRFNFQRNEWTSRIAEKEVLKEALNISITDVPIEGLQTMERVFANLGKHGWKVSSEKKQFTNHQNEIVNYTQLNYKSKNGLSINDSELKAKNNNLNFFGVNGILQEIEKVNQGKLKTETKKIELSNSVKYAAVQASNFEEFSQILKNGGVDLVLKSFQNKETEETIETLRFKVGGATFTSKELGDDLSLDNLRYNATSQSNGFITREMLKTWLIRDVQETLNIEMFKDVLNIEQLNKELENKNWKIEVNEKYFKHSEGYFMPYSQFRYVSLNNEHKFVYDYELREKGEKTNDFSAKSVNTLLDKNKALLVRNSLTNSLDSSKTYEELAHQTYLDSGIIMNREDRTFETNTNNRINYKEYVFYIPTRKQEIISREEFNADWNRIVYDAKTNRNEKVSLSEINKANIGSKITNSDISNILTQNWGDVKNEDAETLTKEFAHEQQATFMDDLKKLVLGRVTQSGYANVRRNDEETDIRSIEEKRKDELRRQGRKI